MMYRGWISERASVESECGCASVLNSYPASVGREVTSSIIRSLVLLPSEKREFFKSVKDLDWTMDVICFGLTMSLAEVEMIKNCVFLYLEWMTVMLNKPMPGIPMQIIENKDHYFPLMLKHVANLFIPRDSTATVIQATLCGKVLQHVRNIAEEGRLSEKSLESVLKFYLGISGHLLSVPPVQGGLAEQLCGKLINCLLNVWLYASCCYFPSPSLWCTLTEMVLTWRHHHVLILQWNKLMYALTSKVLIILYGPNYPLPRLCHNENNKSEPITLPPNMSNEVIVQCWHRFMHIIGNPVDLCKVEEIGSTEYFRRFNAEYGRYSEHHPSLKSLPESFYKAMSGISVMVGMFLGTCKAANKHSFSISSNSFQRGEWKSASTGNMDNRAKTLDLKDKMTVFRKVSEQCYSSKVVRDDSDVKSKHTKDFSGNVADANSILHIFSSWLFEACLAGMNIECVLQSVGKISCAMPLSCLELSKEEKEQSCSFPPARKNDFEPGRAQTFSTLCHIFCHQNVASQAVLPVYLSRFYLSVAVGLCYGETRAGQVLGSILHSATNIFKLDLQGVQILVPHMLQALEIVLPVSNLELDLGYDCAVTELRQSCIQILLSIICLPLHFLSLSIQGLCREKVPHTSEAAYTPPITFLSLRSRITDLLMKALTAETNPANTQMLLGATMLLMEDTMRVELRNYEVKADNKGGCLPCVDLSHSSVSNTESPKLLHIAKPVGKRVDNVARRQKSVFNRKVIGSMGNRNDVLTAKGQFVYISGLLCQKLMFAVKWRKDLSVTLAALDFLSGMAYFDAKFIDEEEAKKSLKWICDYIEFQANQPPPLHSKDLHSIIVAAFACISVWVVNHPWLLDDEHCLRAVMEVIELGISGSKSKFKNGDDATTLKADKELKPVSLRAHESAEALLALIMEHAGFFPTPCGPASMFSLINENDFWSENEKKFSYYVLNGSVIIGFLEDVASTQSESLPSAVCIVRGPIGKRVCLMQLRHFSRDKQHCAQLFENEPQTPSGLLNIPPAPPVSQRCYPPEMDFIEKTKADYSIPDISEIFDEKQLAEKEHMKDVLSAQVEEESASQEIFRTTINGMVEKKQPQPKTDPKCARLFLSHLAMLKLNNLQPSDANPVQGLQFLHSTENDNLIAELHRLDSLPCRTYDTMFVFYIKRGQNEAKDILQNKVPSLDSHLFMEFLHSVGWPVDMATHVGWNGDLVTSWKSKRNERPSGKKMFYYADSMVELAIHVPALNIDVLKNKSIQVCDHVTSSPRITEEIPIFEITQDASATNTSSAVEGKPPTRKHINFEQTGSVEVKHRTHSSQSETKVVVAWLQEFVDEALFPALDLIELCDPHEHSYSTGSATISRVPDREVVIICIHPLKTGLFRIKIKSAFGSPVSGPLVDGMVVSRRVLGSMVRNTAINVCKRRRLDLDSFSPPHVCRKIKIQEIIRENAKHLPVYQQYTSLFA